MESTVYVPEEQIENTILNLQKNRMQAFRAANREAARELVRNSIPEGSLVGTGGSASLEECGILDLLRSGKYRFIDRKQPGISDEQMLRMRLESQHADVFLCSSNAVTEQGELYNVDAFGNRLSAIAFGPSLVIMVVGINKLVKTLEDAVQRVKRVAAPENNRHYNRQSTFCYAAGHCNSLGSCGLEHMTDGCRGANRICCHYMISGWQIQENRIKVILVDEPLGF